MKIAVVSPIEIYPSIGGGQIRILNIIKFLLSIGHEIILISPDVPSNNGSIVALSGLPSSHIFFVEKKQQDAASFLLRNHDITFNKHAAKIVLQQKCDSVYVVFAWAAGIFDFLPNKILKLLDTIDIQYKRYEQLLKQDIILAERRYCMKQEEVTFLSKAHVLIAIQQEEQKELEQMCPKRQVITIDFKPTLKKIGSPKNSKKILFIGNIYEPNILGIRKFLEMHWNGIQKNVPEAELLVVGRVCEALDDIKEYYTNVKLLYFVDNLEKIYQDVAVVINPVEFGTGQSVKTVEAICYGKCVISTPQGVRGIEKMNNLPLEIISLENMGRGVIPFLLNPSLRFECEAKIYEYAIHRFTETQIYNAFVNILESHCKLQQNKLTILEKIKQLLEDTKLYFIRGL